MSNDKAQATYHGGEQPAMPPTFTAANNDRQLRAAKKLQRDGWAYHSTMPNGAMVFYRKSRIKKRWVIFWTIITFGFGLLYFAFAAANRRTETCIVDTEGRVS